MNINETIAAWNAQADNSNSWPHLGEDEKLEWAIKLEREKCAKVVGDFAKKWWSIHCDTNKHRETTLKAHDDFCALQAAIRARGPSKAYDDFSALEAAIRARSKA